MDNLVKRKNLRAKNGKKQWSRNIDVQDLHNANEKIHTAEY